MGNRHCISLVYWASGSGIEKDVRILERTLMEGGHLVRHIVTRNRTSKLERLSKVILQLPNLIFKRDIQIHVEQIHREQFMFGRTNILIPNPEITETDLFRKIRNLPMVFCKSHRAMRLFEQTGMKCHYIGFTSEDRFNPACSKDFRKFIHVAGASNFKGTEIVMALWEKHPEWPKLTVIRTLHDCYGNYRKSHPSRNNLEVIEQWIPGDELVKLQNSSGIHLCPSEMEGFGHYIVEGLSVGSVVVTTDAPPMNELVDDSCGYRVRSSSMGKSYMEDRWSVDACSLEECIKRILARPESELQQMGESARARFEAMDRAFPGRLLDAINAL